jgi:putative ABC transport system permease protein
LLKQMIAEMVRNLNRACLNRNFDMLRASPSILIQAISICSLVLLSQYVRHVRAFEQNWADGARIITFETTDDSSGSNAATYPYTPFLLRDEVMQKNPAIAVATHALENELIVQRENHAGLQKILLTDAAFFQVFKRDTHAGTLRNYGRDTNGVVVSRAFAEKEGITSGSVILGKINEIPEKLTVLAIVEDAPYPTQFKWHVFVPMTQPRTGMNAQQRSGWGSIFFRTYALLKTKTLPAPVVQRTPEGMSFAFTAVPISRLFFDAKAADPMISGLADGKRELFRTFCLLAGIIFLLAALAYVNVTAAQIATRAPEVSLRRLYGASKSRVFSSFMLETFCIMMAAGVMGVCLAALALPAFNATLNADIQLRWLDIDGAPAMMLALVAGLTVVAGSYTATRLAHVPIDVAVRNVPYFSKRRNNRVSQSIVLVQFFVGTVALVMALTTAAQLSFADKHDMGFDNQNSIILSGVDHPAFMSVKQDFETHIGKIPFVSPAGYGNYATKNDDFNTVNIISPYRSGQVSSQIISASASYFSSLKIKVIAGSLERYTTWADGNRPVVINETTLEALRLGHAAAAIGKTLTLLRKDKPSIELTIVAVAADVRQQSLRNPVVPTFYTNDPRKFNHMFLTFSTGKLASGSIWSEELWEDMLPDLPIRMESYQLYFADLIAQDRLYNRLMLALCITFGLTSLIAFWGLCADTSVRRKLEYTLHFLYGANTGTLFRTMGSGIGVWAGCGIVAGFLIAIAMSEHWLGGFTRHTSTPWTAIALAIGAVSWILVSAIILNVRRIVQSDVAAVMKYE